jgi:hypothetical protein
MLWHDGGMNRVCVDKERRYIGQGARYVYTLKPGMAQWESVQMNEPVPHPPLRFRRCRGQVGEETRRRVANNSIMWLVRYLATCTVDDMEPKAQNQNCLSN